jgi:hypothetical protein
VKRSVGPGRGRHELASLCACGPRVRERRWVEQIRGETRDGRLVSASRNVGARAGVFYSIGGGFNSAVSPPALWGRWRRRGAREGGGGPSRGTAVDREPSADPLLILTGLVEKLRVDCRGGDLRGHRNLNGRGLPIGRCLMPVLSLLGSARRLRPRRRYYIGRKGPSARYPPPLLATSLASRKLAFLSLAVLRALNLEHLYTYAS